MKPESFARLKEVLVRVLELSEDERSRYLESVRKEDDSLCREAEALIGRANDLPPAIRTGGLGRMVDTLLGTEAKVADERMPESVGPYRIRGILGEGGMGVVYRAEQTEPIRREVALKLIRGGADSAAVLARFEAERQTLAQMSHPNIAAVLDAGSDEGRPYFVMELVDGIPLTDYCRKPDPRSRRWLPLFLDICLAVRHAHRRGIIHRDLKPSNILVSEAGGKAVPKVIDFSIAKALADPEVSTEFRTRTGQILGTLEYMSPEQARGAVAEVDTRSDVYALGVILYELIAGRRPHDLQGLPLHEALQRIVDEPVTSVRRGTTSRVDRDLDTILHKCLEKDPDRRYGSASELAEDLERYMGSRPILARPPSAGYQARMLVARHRVAFGVTAGLFVLLTAFAITVSIQLGVQRRERSRAEAAAAEARREARRAGRINEFLQEMLASAAPDGSGQDLTVRKLLDETAGRVDGELAGEPEALADAHRTLGVTYGQLGDDDKGLVHLRRALEIHREASGEDSKDTAEDLRSIANALYRKGDYDAAIESGQEALAWWRSTTPAGERVPAPELPALLDALAVIETARGNFDEAERLAREALQHATEGDPGTGMDRSDAEMALANVLWRRGAKTGLEEAESLVRSALEARKEALGPDHPRSLESLNLLGGVIANLEQRDQALRVRYESLLRRRRALEAGHPAIAESAHNLATALLEMGFISAAAPYQEEAIRIWREAYGENHPYLLTARHNLAFMRHVTGDLEEAERMFREVIDQARKSSLPNQVRASMGMLVEVLLQRGVRLDEAERIHLNYRSEYPLDPNSPTREALFAIMIEGLVKLEQGRLAEAETLFRQSIAAADALGRKGDWPRAALALVLGRTEGKEAALPYLTPLERALLSGRPFPSWSVRYWLTELAELRESWGDLAEAEALRQEMARRDAVAQSEPDLITGLDPELLASLASP